MDWGEPFFVKIRDETRSILPLDKKIIFVYYVVHMTFGKFIRSVRDKKYKEDRSILGAAGCAAHWGGAVVLEARSSETRSRRLRRRLYAAWLGSWARMRTCCWRWRAKFRATFGISLCGGRRLFAELLRQLKGCAGSRDS